MLTKPDQFNMCVLHKKLSLPVVNQCKVDNDCSITEMKSIAIYNLFRLTQNAIATTVLL